MRYVTGLGAEEGWARIAESIARREATPCDEPYFLGGSTRTSSIEGSAKAFISA